MKKIKYNTAGASSSTPPPPPPPPPHPHPPRPLRPGLPPGYRFKPSDIEAMHLLRHKIETGASLMPEIKDIQLYQYTPETLARMYAPLGDDEWYFFTSTQRKNPNAKRPDRLVAAGDGFWRAMTAVTEVKHGEQTVGKKLTLVYHTGKNRSGTRTCWLMHEYRVEEVHVPTHANDMMLSDWVLCKIYKNARTVKADQRRQMEGIVIGRAPAAAAAGYEEFNDGDEDEDDYSRELTDPQLQGFHHHPPFPNKAAAKFNNGDAGYSRALTNQRQGFLHHPQSPYQSMLPNQAAAGFNNGDAGYSRPLTNQRQGFLHHPQSPYQSMLPNQATAGFKYNGDAGYSRALTNQRQGFLHHPQPPNQTMLPNQVAAAAGFNNGGEDSRAVINPRKRFLHHPHEYPNQTMPFNRTAAAEFNNGGSTSSGCMMMAAQHHHHHNPLYDPTINPIYQLAAVGAREFHDSGEGCSKMAEISDMGDMFNPRNYYNPFLDQPSPFNTYANHHQAEGSHRVDKGKDPIYYPNLDQYSSLPSSSNAGAQAQAQVASEERLNNGGGKATASNDQECYRPAPLPDQVQVPSDKNNSSAINGEGNIEGFSMNERGYCMINGERVEMGEDFMTTSMAEAAAAFPSPSNFGTTDFANLDYFSILDDFDYDYNNITGS